MNDNNNVFHSSFIARTRARKNLCKLDDFTKFRLCSAAYVAWGQYSNELSRWNFIEENVENDCVNNVIIHFDEADEKDERTRIPTILLSCSVNDGSHGPQFYLTADSIYRDAVYVIILESDESEGPRYVLDMRLTDLISLRMIRVVALTENFQTDDVHNFTTLKSKEKKTKILNDQNSMLKRLMSSVSFNSHASSSEVKPVVGSNTERKPSLKKLLSNISFRNL